MLELLRQHKMAAINVAAALLLLSLCGLWLRVRDNGYRAIRYPEEITIDVYDEMASQDGIQTGWFAKAVQDRFHMSINVIAPDPGDATSMLDSMLAAGDLGDIVITSARESALESMVQQGVLCDLTPYLKGREILRYRAAIDALNEGLGGIYAIPSAISEGAPNEPSEALIPSACPMIRWDLYRQIGYPKLEKLEDLLSVLQRMQELARQEYPDRGIYAMSFTMEQDGGLLEIAKQIAAVYGYTDEGIVLVNGAGDIQNLLDSQSVYMRALRFLYEANRCGLIDPESLSQTEEDVEEKVRNGEVLFTFDPMLADRSFNTLSNLEGDLGFFPAFCEDLKVLSKGCSVTGDESCVIAVGAAAKDAARMADFIDWLYSDEGVLLQQAGGRGTPGPRGLTWEMTGSEPGLTSLGTAVLMDHSDIALPDEWGKGTFQGGASLLAYPARNLKGKTREGVPLTFRLWEESGEEKRRSAIWQDWCDYYNTGTAMEYLEDHGMLQIMPGGYTILPADGAETRVIRDSCEGEILEDSKRMIFAEDDAAFDNLKEEMQSVCAGLNYSQIFRIDLSSARIISSWKQRQVVQ